MDFKFLRKFWTMVGLGLSFQNSGLDLDRKIWQSAHLWSRSHECKPWRHKPIWREWLLPSSWFSLRNRQENLWRLLRQRTETEARKGLHRVHLWWKVKAFYWGYDEPCASLFL